MTTNDGGPAFPIPMDDRPGAYEAHPGMTLRDYFAAKALQGILANSAKDFDPVDAAEEARKSADALLAELAKEQTP